jgi:hypothetical protein
MPSFLELMTVRHKKKPQISNKVRNQNFTVALMFLTYRNVNHPNMWNAFLAEKKGCQFKPYIHCKNEFTCQLGFDRYIIKNRTKTKWGHKSLVTATLRLIQESLKNPENQFFVLLSNSCIPLRNPEEILNDLSKDGRSRMHYRMSNVSLDNFFSVSEFWGPGPHVYQSQWMLLNRKAAMFFAQKNLVTHFYDGAQIILDEHYFANICLKYGLEFDNTSATYVNWKESTEKCHPKTYSTLTSQNVRDIKKNHPRAFFMRKLDVGAAIEPSAALPWKVNLQDTN